MADHGARGHATWSASATARNWHCPGALALAQTVTGEEKESEHAARGTACHQIAEKSLRTGVDPSVFLGEVEKTKQHSITIDEELVNSATEYVDYVRKQQWRYESALGGAIHLQIEQHFSLSDLNPPFDAGGTGDAVLYCDETKELEIVDLKNGMGVVDVEGNPQLRTYALGALLANPGLDVETVTVTIVQPRAPHKDGRIRSDPFHVADLVDWTTDLLAAMNRSKQALDEFLAAGSNTVLLDAWADKWLNPGKCKFCPVEGSCPKLRKQALDVAAIWFDDLDQPRIGNSALETSPEALGHDLDMLEMLEDWIKARRALAHTMAEQGADIPGYQLVEKIGNRKWAADDDKVAADLAAVAGLDEKGIFDRKLRSVAQVEKVLGAKRKHLIESMWMRPVTGTNLVSIDKTTRPAAKSTAERYFEPST